MKLFDLHCDTPYELYRQNKSLSKNDLHISLERASVFDKYIQCAAVWSDNALTDKECLESFLKITDRFEKEADGLLIRNRKDLENSKKSAFILTVEDARLLCSDISNLDLLYKKGVRVLTLTWGGHSTMGGAWNTDDPFTKFGEEVIYKCFSKGIIPDISHTNDKAQDRAVLIASELGKPLISTHSNSRAVCPHKRNLTDDRAKKIASLGGIIGISLYPPHLFGDSATVSHITDHIAHYINITGTSSVCLGCDFDGIDKTPKKIENLGDLPCLYDAVSARFNEDIAEKVFFKNAYNFFKNNLPQG